MFPVNFSSIRYQKPLDVIQNSFIFYTSLLPQSSLILTFNWLWSILFAFTSLNRKIIYSFRWIDVSWLHFWGPFPPAYNIYMEALTNICMMIQGRTRNLSRLKLDSEHATNNLQVCLKFYSPVHDSTQELIKPPVDGDTHATLFFVR